MSESNKPTSVTVFGILNLVFGGLGVLCTPFSLVGIYADQGPHNPLQQIMQEQPWFEPYLLFSSLLGFILAAVLIVAGVGLLTSKPWGRSLSLAYAWVTIVMVIAGTVINYIVYVQPMLGRDMSGMSPEEQGAFIGGAVGGMCGTLIGVIYPILLIIFMRRRVVRDYFDAVRAGNIPGVPEDRGTPIESPTRDPWQS